jgi:hypothetical protein
MRYLTLFTLLFLPSLSFGETTSLYDNLRLKLNDKAPKNSQIAASSLVQEEEPISLDEATEAKKSICRKDPKSSECAEYSRLTKGHDSDEICARNPLGRKCQKIRANLETNLFKRQALCRPGLKTRKCMIARNQAKRKGLIE